MSSGEGISIARPETHLFGGSVEQKERELKKRLDEVETDKLKLLGGIGELDKSKREALITMWKKVDE